MAVLFSKHIKVYVYTRAEVTLLSSPRPGLAEIKSKQCHRGVEALRSHLNKGKTKSRS